MKSARSRSWSALLSMAMVAGVVTVSAVSAGSALAATGTYDPANPPYPADSNSVTTVRVYDVATGNEVKSGSIDAPLNSYYFAAAADFGTADAGGGRKAQLSGFLAETGKVPTAFSGQLLGPATTFPATAGSTTFSNPTARGGSTNTFGGLAASYPNTAASTDNFYQLYQVRVRTTFPTPTSTTYAILDVQIDPTTGIWHEVKPATAPYNDPPNRPTAPTATAGNTQATVAFTAPSTPSGAPILDYSVVATPTNPAGPSLAPVVVTSSPAVVPGLTNGTSYTFTVSARNANGSSAKSPASNAVTPQPPTAPVAPAAPTATAGNGQATVTFTAPSSDGGSTVTGYTVTAFPGGAMGTSTSVSPITVNGLTNSTAYTFTVRATNAVGDSPESVASNSVTPATIPGAPTAVTAAAGTASASVAFTAPASNGGGAITGYTVMSTPGNVVASGTTSPITVTGLTNGTAYTFTVHATNSAGNGPESAASNAVTPAAVPSAPLGVSATPGDTTAAVSWTAPAANGSAITSYDVTAASSGAPVTKNVTGATSTTLTGLTNGTVYSVTVKANNGVGASAASAAASVTPRTVPGVPTAVTATRGNASASVAFTTPASNGGAAITGYTVTSTPGGATVSGTSSPITVTGLTNGTAYTFTVHATNAAGNGAESAASSAVTPANVPGAPTIGSATTGNAQATVSFTAPATTGGSALTGYTVTSSPGGATVSGTSSPLTVTGLTNGTSYTFTVHATNAVGNGAESGASNAVTPFTTPGTPTIGAVTAGNAQATVAFSPPSSNGGSAVTSYTVTSTPGGLAATGTGSPITVTGLTNGTTYTFTVHATNAAGDSPESGASSALTPSAATDTTTTLTDPSPVLGLGGSVTLTGQVSGITGAASVTLRTTVDHGRSADVVYSAPDGVFSLKVTPRYDATYQLLFLGDGSHLASSSSVVRSNVKQLVLFGGVRIVGGKVTVTGRVAPAAPDALVILGEMRAGSFVPVVRVRPGADGRFSLTSTFSKGYHRLQVYAQDTALNKAGSSVKRDYRV